MHSSVDRDNYVKINYENVIWGLSYAFSKYNSNNFGTSYDLGMIFLENFYLIVHVLFLESVMHYDPFYFSNNGKPTIEPLDRSFLTNKKMGQRVGLSPGDVKRINNMYQC
jgi:Astacin (Peptidase family M12A)